MDKQTRHMSHHFMNISRQLTPKTKWCMIFIFTYLLVWVDCNGSKPTFLRKWIILCHARRQMKHCGVGYFSSEHPLSWKQIDLFCGRIFGDWNELTHFLASTFLIWTGFLFEGCASFRGQHFWVGIKLVHFFYATLHSGSFSWQDSHTCRSWDVTLKKLLIVEPE